MSKKTQKYTIQDFECIGTLTEIESALSKLQFDISCTDADTIDEINDNNESFYDDGVVSCTLLPMA